MTPTHPEAAWQAALELLPGLEACALEVGMKQSTGGLARDWTVYTGLGGVAVAYLRIAQHMRDTDAAKFFSKALQASQRCLQHNPNSQEVSFYCGTVGAHAIAAVAAYALGDTSTFESNAAKLVHWSKRALRHRDDELLFGRAGYMYALLWVRQSAADYQGFNEALAANAEQIVASGQSLASSRYADWSLMWHCFDDPYLGAAHGHVGILAMLLHCWGLLSEKSQALVEGTLDQLLTLCFKSGNLPIILGEDSDQHVHW